MTMPVTERPIRGSMTPKHVLKGVGAILAVVFGPFFVGLALWWVALALGLNRLANWAVFVVLAWSFLLLPHLGITPPPTPLTGWLALVLPLTQWTIVGVVVSRLAKGNRTRRLPALTIAAVGAVALLTHLLIYMLGLKVVVEGA